MQKIETGKTYKHYKGNIYKIIALAKHSETNEDMVVYQNIKKGDIWTRPKSMWNDKIEEGVLRFSLIEEEWFKVLLKLERLNLFKEVL